MYSFNPRFHREIRTLRMQNKNTMGESQGSNLGEICVYSKHGNMKC